MPTDHTPILAPAPTNKADASSSGFEILPNRHAIQFTSYWWLTCRQGYIFWPARYFNVCFITLFLFSSPLPFSLPFFMSFKFFHVFQFGQKFPPPKGGESVNVRKKSLLDPFRNGLGSRIEGPHMFCMYISSLSKTRDMKQTVTDIPYKDKFTWYFYPLGKYSLT